MIVFIYSRASYVPTQCFVHTEKLDKVFLKWNLVNLKKEMSIWLFLIHFDKNRVIFCWKNNHLLKSIQKKEEFQHEGILNIMFIITSNCFTSYLLNSQ